MAEDGKQKDGASAGVSLEAEVERVARRDPTGWRSPALMLAIAGFSLYLGWSFRAEVAYFFSDPNPIELGEEGVYHLDRARPNRFASISGLPSLAKLQYKQLGQGYKVFFVLGSRVFVRADLESKKGRSGEEGVSIYRGRGRLVDLREEAEFQPVRQWYAERTGFDFSRPAWILLDDVEPRKQWQYPLGVLVLVAVALLNVFLLGRRLLRRS
ncbi:MAG: hypothetical protein P1V51_25300 [Deltaproteobacteria bacterium]|nr:hypothetical protein [Deltaproteobacteria bacterium]